MLENVSNLVTENTSEVAWLGEGGLDYPGA